MFDEKRIILLTEPLATKEEVIRHLTHIENDCVPDADLYEQAVSDREASFATYTIDGVAIPHAKSNAVATPFVVFARLKAPVPWGTEPGEDARMVFLIGVPEAAGGTGTNLHLKILAALSKKLMHASFRHRLEEASSTKELYQILQEIEEELK
ncbi:PTS sugar transporter subunit IIA [Selenomonas artemidis]|uniref:PTS sugar transporter subunit IIA n=1 Tax=Selenomonas artemidis TaxID=671224 RepID=UPI0023EF8404|nr:PTS sugar transporter subunit IIA [Selenomonas artemidis]